MRLHEAVEGLDGVYAIADDILVGGVRETMQGAIAGHHLKIKKPLTRCEERGVKLNKQKEVFKQTELPCTEHLLTSKRDPPKIAAVLNMENRTVPFVVQLILGTVNLTKFLLCCPKFQSLSGYTQRRTRNFCGMKSMVEHSIGSRRW